MLVQFNRVYIYKLWDACSFLNPHDGGELAVPMWAEECLTGRTGGAETSCFRPFLLIYCDIYTVGGSTVVYF